MADRKKSPREVRKILFELAQIISPETTLSSVVVYASRKVTLATTVGAGGISPEATAIDLNANPGIGALVIVNPGSMSNEETFKIISVSGSSAPFTCGITPSAEMTHAGAEAVNYEPGVSTPLLVDDTPTVVGTGATLLVQQGADGQTYRLSMIGTCSNGEIIEHETDLEVVEFAPVTTLAKQPAETWDVAVDFAEYTNFYATTLSSAIAFVARTTSVNTTLASQANAGATSVSLSAHPGTGALLTLNPAGVPPNSTREKVWVSSVSGSGPFTASVSPLQFGHSNGEDVSYLPGVTARVLVSGTATIDGTEAIFRLRRGAAARTYHAIALGTLADGQVVQKAISLSTPEL
jgi:hypothetical protein